MYRPSSSPHTSIRTGDVIRFDRKGILAAVKAPNRAIDTLSDGPPRPDAVDLVWIDGYSMTPSRGIPRDSLDKLREQNKLSVSMRGVENGWDVMRMADDVEPHSQSPASRDTAIQIGPRMPVSDLSFERIYSRNRFNGFVDHPVVDHKHGRVQKAKAMFIARRPDGRPAAALSLNSPNSRNAFDRKTVEITRYASHPATSTRRQTNNTATWMISRACHWAGLEGYSTVRTLVGTDSNTGAIYEAANFKSDGEANSSGSHNRDGRKNHTHASTLNRYICDVTVDGANATAGLSRRFESRIETGQSTTSEALTLSQFGSGGGTNSHGLVAKKFRLTREEASDTKFTSADTADEYSVFSRELKQLIASSTASVELESYHRSRGNHTPAAVFGAAVGDTLVAAAIISGDPQTAHPTAQVEEYITRNTEYPQQTVQWILTHIRDWVELGTYQSLRVPRDTFDTVSGVGATVPQGVGFDHEETCHIYRCE